MDAGVDAGVDADCGRTERASTLAAHRTSLIMGEDPGRVDDGPQPNFDRVGFGDASDTTAF